MNDFTATRALRQIDGPGLGECEYLSVPVRRPREPLRRDVYTQLGWTVDGAIERGVDTTNLRMHRPRTLPQRAALNELQHRSEQAMDTLDELDRSIETWGTRTRIIAQVAGGVYSLLATFALNAGMATHTVVILIILFLGHTLGAGHIASQARHLRATKVDSLVTAQLDIVEDAVSAARTIHEAAPAAHPGHGFDTRAPITLGAAIR